MASRGFLGSGNVYINRKVAGVPQGLKGPYYAGQFEIQPNVETKELISKGRDDYGQTIESVTIQQPADFNMSLTEVNTESLTLALLGTSASATQASGTMTDQAVVAKLGAWVDLGHAALDELITVENSGGTVTYIEGTDYKLNRPMGWLMALDGGAIADAATVNVSGAYDGYTGTQIRGATNADIRAEIIFDGKNAADGLPVIVTIHEAIIAADSAFDFLADDFNEVGLTGKMKTPTGKTEPFTVVLRNAA